MASTKTSRPRGGRAGVIDAAVEKFHTLGYHGTSMRNIADAAHVTVASIYHHFPSKQEILNEIMIGVMRDVMSQTTKALINSGPSPEDQLRALVVEWVEFHAEHREVALIGGSEIRSLDADGRALVVSLRDKQEKMFLEVVERGIEEGVFTTPYPKEAVRSILNMGTAVSSWYRPDGYLAPAELAKRYADFATQIVQAPPGNSA